MRQSIVSWYAYAQAGTATVEPTPRPDLDDPARVAELYGDVRRADAELTPDGWKHLWSRYGLEGLIDLARGAGFPDDAGDADVAGALVEESVAAGYDPVSGRFGECDETSETVELIES